MDCAYADPDDMLIDAIIAGVREKRVQERLLDKGEELTLAKAIEIPQQYEISQKQLKIVRDDVTCSQVLQNVFNLSLLAKAEKHAIQIASSLSQNHQLFVLAAVNIPITNGMRANAQPRAQRALTATSPTTGWQCAVNVLFTHWMLKRWRSLMMKY